MPKIIKKHGKIALVLGLILVLIATYVLIPLAKASGTMPNRKVTISDSTPATTGVDYAFTADFTASTVKCIEVVFSAAAVSAGMDTTSATQGAAADWGAPFTLATWADIEKATNGTVRFWDTTGEAGASGKTFGIGTIKNPTANSYSAKINTYNPTSCTNEATCCTGTKTDEGTVMFAIIAGVTVSATVSESMSFTRLGLVAGSCTGDTGTKDATIDTSGDTDLVPFGILGSNFTVACQQLTVTTNAAHGYVVTEQEDDQLSFDSITFADTVCDSSACPAADSNAAAWTDTSTVSGFGHGCQKSSGDGVVCAAAYDVWASNKYYRKFASIADVETAQALMSYTAGAPTVSHVAIIHYKIKKGALQSTGTYQNAIVYIATPTY